MNSVEALATGHSCSLKKDLGHLFTATNIYKDSIDYFGSRK